MPAACAVTVLEERWFGGERRKRTEANSLSAIRSCVLRLPFFQEGGFPPRSFSLPESRTDDGAELGVVGDEEADAEAVREVFKYAADGLNCGQIADENDVPEGEAAGGKDREHGNRFTHHIGNAQGHIGIGGEIRELAEIGGREILIDAVVGVAAGDVLDPKIHTVKIAVGRELLDVLDGIHPEHPAGEPKQRAAADAGAAEIFDLVIVIFAGGVDESRAGAHAHHNGLLQAGEIEAANSAAGKFRHGVAFEIVNAVFYHRGAGTGHHDAVDVAEFKMIFGGEFSKGSVNGGQGIGGTHKLRSDQLTLSLVVFAEADDLCRGASNINSDHSTVHGGSFQNFLVHLLYHPLAKIAMVWYNILRKIFKISRKWEKHRERLGFGMAFDAGMLACVLDEIKKTALGARIEKVFQPERDEIVLQMRSFEGGRRLLINAGSNSPRLGFTTVQKENPMSPPMFCMLLRKHLQGAKLTEVSQAGFERVAMLTFETRDEMGFDCSCRLIVEIMGKYSNLMFADASGKIIAVLRPVDFTTSSRRQVLPGMIYELPPAQEKQDPMTATPESFAELLLGADRDQLIEKLITRSYLGISACVAREIAYRAGGRVDATVGACDLGRLTECFFEVIRIIREGDFAPCMVTEGERPVEYAFLELQQYGGLTLHRKAGAGELLDAFFGSRDREYHIRQRAADVLHILTAADARIRKKLELQRQELADCEKGVEYKKNGDLITANLHMLTRGMTRVELTDYEDYREDGSFGVRVVELDARLSPAANAQRLYKRYNKSKTARVELTRQIELGEAELAYLDSVFDALSHAETAADLTEIRDELYRSGYASRMKHYALSRKSPAPVVAQFTTTDGYRVLCGKNNLQNEYITHKLAAKTDYWFHVKNMPGSHTVMLCNGEEPPERAFTEAAEIAAYFSRGAGGQNVEVDYTQVRNVKKPSGTKPGFVIYHTNWSCIVTPSAERIAKMRVK